jgi:hypothetical protein
MTIKELENSFFSAVLGHLGTHKWIKKDIQRTASRRDAWPNVLA